MTRNASTTPTVRRRIEHPWLLFGGLAVVLSGLVTFFVLEDDPKIYAYSVADVVHGRAQARRVLRVTGFLVHGTLQRPGECQVTLRMSSSPEVYAGGAGAGDPSQLTVRYDSCQLPDTVCDLPNMDLRMMVEGRLFSTGSRLELVADRLFSTCPGKYEVEGSRNACRSAPEALRRLCPICQAVLLLEPR